MNILQSLTKQTEISGLEVTGIRKGMQEKDGVRAANHRFCPSRCDCDPGAGYQGEALLWRELHA